MSSSPFPTTACATGFGGELTTVVAPGYRHGRLVAAIAARGSRHPSRRGCFGHVLAATRGIVERLPTGARAGCRLRRPGSSMRSASPTALAGRTRRSHRSRVPRLVQRSPGESDRVAGAQRPACARRRSPTRDSHRLSRARADRRAVRRAELDASHGVPSWSIPRRRAVRLTPTVRSSPACVRGSNHRDDPATLRRARERRADAGRP